MKKEKDEKPLGFWGLAFWLLMAYPFIYEYVDFLDLHEDAKGDYIIFAHIFTFITTFLLYVVLYISSKIVMAYYRAKVAYIEYVKKLKEQYKEQFEEKERQAKKLKALLHSSKPPKQKQQLDKKALLKILKLLPIGIFCFLVFMVFVVLAKLVETGLLNIGVPDFIAFVVFFLIVCYAFGFSNKLLDRYIKHQNKKQTNIKLTHIKAFDPLKHQGAYYSSIKNTSQSVCNTIVSFKIAIAKIKTISSQKQKAYKTSFFINFIGVCGLVGALLVFIAYLIEFALS